MFVLSIFFFNLLNRRQQSMKLLARFFAVRLLNTGFQEFFRILYFLRDLVPEGHERLVNLLKMSCNIRIFSHFRGDPQASFKENRLLQLVH